MIPCWSRRCRVAAWAAGALLIPSLALLLGSFSRSRWLFQALYVPLWYAAIDQLAAADYMQNGNSPLAAAHNRQEPHRVGAQGEAAHCP